MRPSLHFTPSSGWVNDPYGIGWRDGRYEMFFQRVLDATEWRPELRWGRATSPDLVSWEDRGVALSPDGDEVGCWSGDVLQRPDGSPLIAYTSVREPDLDLGSVRLAYPSTDDGLLTPGPVVLSAPAGVSVFRDPSLSVDGEGLRMLVGAGRDEGRPLVLGFRSDDGLTWTSTGSFAEPPHETPVGLAFGSSWECPHLIEVDGHAVLLVSAWEGPMRGEVLAAVGSVRGDAFDDASWQRLTYGESHYAATPFQDRDGHWCLLMWLKTAKASDGAWTGAHSVAYRLGVEGGRVALNIHPDVLASASLPTNDAYVIDAMPGDEISLPKDAWGGTTLRVVDDGVELHGEVEERVATGRLQAAQLVVDGSIVELRAEEFVCGVTAPA